MKAEFSPVPSDLPHQAACTAAAALLSAATLITALWPSITVAAVPLAPRIVDLPRVFIKGAASHAALAIGNLPRVIVIGTHTA